MLERGFHYFPSPEGSDDYEIMAHLFLYWTVAVDEWPHFRRKLEREGTAPELCDRMERHAINVFREVRDTILTAIETGNSRLMSQPRLIDQMVHAHAFMALHADPMRLVEYLRMICPEINSQHDFNLAVWGGNWLDSIERLPAEVTREESRRNWFRRQKDGLYDTNGSLDCVAMAGDLDPMFPATEPVSPLSALQLAYIRARLFKLGIRQGLTKSQAEFLVRMALDGAKQEDNPSAWRAIRDRKRCKLLPKVQELLDSARPNK